MNIPVRDVECDEIWGFVQKKEAHKRGTELNSEGIGDAFCFVAMERNTKLILNFALGRRNQATTNAVILGLRAATAPQHFQITTDGFGPYVPAIRSTLYDRVDYGMLIKIYASPREGEARYSPADVVEAVPKPVLGNPRRSRICTSHIERQKFDDENADPQINAPHKCYQ